MIENEIFWKGIFGGFEKISLSIWSELCENASVVFDIGANTGIYALLAKASNPKIQVFAFEPVERIYSKLCRNIQLNHYDIMCYKKAVSNKNGTAVLFDNLNEHIYTAAIHKNIKSSNRSLIPIEVETLRLDTFIESVSILNIDAVKIDVEKHEVEVLEGLGHYLNIYEPILLIEVLDDEVALGVERITSNINYEYYLIDEMRSIKRVDSLARKSKSYNFLIGNPEKLSQLKTFNHFLELNEV